MDRESKILNNGKLIYVILKKYNCQFDEDMYQTRYDRPYKSCRYL